MPDLLDFTISREPAQQLTVPIYRLEGRVVDSQTQQTTIRDFTGANAVRFPQVLGSLTAEERDELVELIAIWLLRKRFPQDWT